MRDAAAAVPAVAATAATAANSSSAVDRRVRAPPTDEWPHTSKLQYHLCKGMYLASYHKGLWGCTFSHGRSTLRILSFVGSIIINKDEANPVYLTSLLCHEVAATSF